MRIRLLPTAATALLLAALAASAQEGGQKPGMPPPRPKPHGGPVFTPPEEEPEKPAEPPPPPAPPKSEMEILLGALGTWPSPEARTAAEALALRWAEAKPLVLEALRTPSPEGRRAAGASAAARLSGDPDAIPALLGAMRDTRNFRWCGEILDGVVALDPVGAKDRLFPLLTVPSSLVVDRVARALQPLLGPGDVPILKALLSSKLAGTRRAALGMAAEADFPAIREDLLAALGDPSPEVAAAAAMTLSHRAGPEGVPGLNALARGEDLRRASYAVLTLLMAAEGASGPPLEDATVACLLGSRGLRSQDPLARAVAALALADVGYARHDPVVDPILEAEVVPALLDMVTGTRLHADLMALRPQALLRLRRLCPGTEEVQSGPDWAKWWESRRGGFVARRALVSLPASVRGDLRVRVDGAGPGPAGPCLYSAEASGAPPGGGAGGKFVALAKDEADRIAAAVESSGVLALPEVQGEESQAPRLEIGVEAGRRGRTVRFHPGAEPPAGVRALLDVLARVREDGLWQRYWDRRAATTFGAFVEGERAFWKGGADAAERSRRLVRLAVGSLADLAEDADRLEALHRIAAEPGLREAMRPPDADAVASLAVAGAGLAQVPEAALRALAAAGMTEGLSILLAKLETARDEGDRSALEGILEDTFRACPPAAVFEAASGRSGVVARGAAVRALGARGDRGDAQVLAAIAKAAAAPEPAVRGAAYLALGRLRAEGAVGILADAVEQETDGVARAGALEGLGLHGGASVVPVLGRAASSPDAGVRAAALRGLGAAKEPEGLSFLLAALTADPDPAVRVEADRAVRSLGGDRAREALRALALDRRRDAETRARAVEGLGLLGAGSSLPDLRALLGDAEDSVADAAAFALAWVRDGAGAPRVLEALRAGRSPGRALQGIELLSLESFRGSRDRAEAVALYTGWYEVSRDRGPRGWLADALAARGLGDAGLRDFTEGTNPRAAVPALLQALSDPSWALRRAANLELERISGRAFGDLDPWTPESKAASVAASWGEWWEKERGARR